MIFARILILYFHFLWEISPFYEVISITMHSFLNEYVHYICVMMCICVIFDVCVPCSYFYFVCLNTMISITQTITHVFGKGFDMPKCAQCLCKFWNTFTLNISQQWLLCIMLGDIMSTCMGSVCIFSNPFNPVTHLALTYDVVL